MWYRGRGISRTGGRVTENNLQKTSDELFSSCVCIHTYINITSSIVWKIKLNAAFEMSPAAATLVLCVYRKEIENDKLSGATRNTSFFFHFSSLLHLRARSVFRLSFPIIYLVDCVFIRRVKRLMKLKNFYVTRRESAERNVLLHFFFSRCVSSFFLVWAIRPGWLLLARGGDIF